MADDPRQLLRRSIRANRASLDAALIEASAQQLQNMATGLQELENISRLAGYLATAGEMDPCHLLAIARKNGAKSYLPVTRNGRLLFAEYDEETALVPGRYKIPVPEYSESELLSPQSLDAVLVPMLAFDLSLNRIGMGGGYYDKTFAFRADNALPPVLIGLAHEFQKVAELDAQPWDIPMDCVLTERAVYRRNQ